MISTGSRGCGKTCHVRNRCLAKFLDYFWVCFEVSR
jgi:hypothetical protein